MTRYLVIALSSLVFAACAADASVDNEPPNLQFDVSPQLEYTVGEGVVRITLTAEDPEGGPVTLEMTDGPERAEFQTQGSWAVFTWDPLPQDVTPSDGVTTVVFAAIDQRGARTEKSVSIIVIASNGIPRFISPTSILHNVTSSDTVSFDVTVRDDDSASVAIRMPPGFAPEGSEFTKTNDFGGRFGWRPTEAQLQERVHTVKFVADDGQNEPIEQDITIILKKDSMVGGEERDLSGCAFEALVDYSPIEAQHSTSNYTLEASLTAAGARFDRLVLYYTSNDAYNESDAMWESVDMSKSGNDFSAVIVNPLLEMGETREYYLEICAIDDDPPQGESDALCGPSSLYESFIAYSPGDSECADDDDTYYDDFEFAQGLESNVWERMRMCEGQDDYFELGVGTQQEAEIFVTYPLGKRPKIELFDTDQNLISEAEHSECSGYSSFTIRNEGAPTKRYVRVSATEDGSDIPYQVLTSVYDLTPDSACADAANEPNNTPDEATVVATQSAQFTGLEICRKDDVDYFAVDLEVGQKVTASVSFTAAVGDLDMKLFRPTQAAEAAANTIAADYSLGTDDDEEVEWVAQEAGVHWIVVYSYDNPNRYSMTVSVEDVVACVDNDVFGGTNTTQSTSDPIGEGTTAALKLCGRAQDWYSFFVLDYQSESFIIEVEATTGALDNLSLEVWDLFGKVSDGRVEDGKLVVDFFAFEDGDHWIVVRSTADTTYDLSFTSLLSI